MVETFAKDFLEELSYDLEVKDFIKAQYVLNQLDLVDIRTRGRAVFALSKTDEGFVIALLTEVLARRPDLGESCPSLKKILWAKALSGQEEFLALFEDARDTDQKIVLAETAGKICMKEASPILRGFLNRTHDGRLLKHAIKALGKIGDSDAVSLISEHLYSWDAELTKTAIFALGQIGSSDAFQRLAERMGSDRDIDIIVLKTLSGNPESGAFKKLDEALFAQNAHLRNKGEGRPMRIEAQSVSVLSKNRVNGDTDLLPRSKDTFRARGDESALSVL
jgi:HEAT repeat protein